MLEFNISCASSFDLPIEDGQVLLLLPQGQEKISDSEYEVTCRQFSSIGYDLIYLPKLIEALPERLVNYFVPEQNGAAPLPYDVVQSRILGELGLSLGSPTAVIHWNGKLLSIMPENGDEIPSEFPGQLLNYLADGDIPEIGIIPEGVCLESLAENRCKDIFEDSEAFSKSCMRDETQEDYTEESLGEEFRIDQLLDELRRSNEWQLRGLGLSEAALRFILGYETPKLSRMTITRHSKIILDDYSGLEIKLDDKTKALYFLFLRHPEGIAIKDLPEHMNELMDLYQSISGRDDPDAMRKTIENLADPFQNNANISLSRIKKAFCEAFTQSLASKYYVDGERGGLRRIALDRGNVTWETIR